MSGMEESMIELLGELKENYHVCGVKAEFEAEGSRFEEVLRLKDIGQRAGLGLSLKIGGCEAIRDLLEAIELGVERVIAPMVESPYALKKYLAAVALALGNGRERGIECLINVETITAYRNFEAMLQLSEIRSLDGVVIGRSDLSASMGLGKEDIEGAKIRSIALDIARQAKDAGLAVVVGGGVTFESLPFFQGFAEGQIDRFETRKVIFRCPAALTNPEIAFRKAIEFEWLWLKQKRSEMPAMNRLDDARVKIIEERYRLMGRK